MNDRGIIQPPVEQYNPRVYYAKLYQPGTRGLMLVTPLSYLQENHHPSSWSILANIANVSLATGRNASQEAHKGQWLGCLHDVLSAVNSFLPSCK